MIEKKLPNGVIILQEKKKKTLVDIKKAVSDLRYLIKVKFGTREGRRVLKNYIRAHPFTWFSIGGTICFIYDIILTVILTEAFNLWSMLSYFIALVTGLVFLYFFHSIYTFQKMDRIERRMLKFFFVMVTSYVFNWILVYILIEHYYYHYFPAIILITIILSFFNYYFNNKWVFRKYQLFE